MLAGFEQPTEGRVLIDGQDMTGVPPYARPVNMMFQSYALFPHMSVAQNVGYGLKHEPMSKAEARDRVEEMLDLVQLKGLEAESPTSSPAASASASHWRGRWRSGRSSCFSTSRSARSTRSSASRRSSS